MPLYDTQLVRAAERCRYWPSCEKGGACTFHHPSKLCTRFPNCYFGDQCNFIHPFCKFDTRCTKPQCPFFHTSREATYVVLFFYTLCILIANTLSKQNAQSMLFLAAAIIRAPQTWRQAATFVPRRRSELGVGLEIVCPCRLPSHRRL